LRIVQDFLNTSDWERGEEHLETPAALRSWLAGRVPLASDADVDRGDLRRAIELREALRELIAAHNRLPTKPDAHLVVNKASARARLRPVLDADGRSRLEPHARPIDAALGRIIAAVHESVADRTWVRLKACQRDTCRWAFYDRSKNGSGRWCAMAGSCGSREKNKRAYRRRRAASGAK